MHRVQSHKLIPTFMKKRQRKDSTENASRAPLDDLNNNQLNNNVEKPPETKRKATNKRSVLPQRFRTQAPELHLWRKAPEGWSQNTEMIFSILSTMRKDEIRFLPMAQPTSDIEPWMRATLFDWLVQVDNHLELEIGTLFRATQLIDRYVRCGQVTTDNYQLLGIVAVWIATKLEERCQAEIAELVGLTDGTSAVEEAFEMERSVLQKLNFRLNIPEPAFYVTMYADMCSHLLSERGRELLVRRCWYVLDLFVGQPQAIDTVASKAAAAAVCLMLEVANDSWPDSIQMLVGYSKADLFTLMQFMAVLALIAKANKYAQGAYTKFSSGRMGNVAKELGYSKVLLRHAQDCVLRPLSDKLDK